MPMETSTMESGKKTKQTASESLSMLIMPCMKVNGWMINNTVKVKKPGANKVVRQQHTQVNSTKERRTAKVDFSGKTALTMRVIS